MAADGHQYIFDADVEDIDSGHTDEFYRGGYMVAAWRVGGQKRVLPFEGPVVGADCACSRSEYVIHSRPILHPCSARPCLINQSTAGIMNLNIVIAANNPAAVAVHWALSQVRLHAAHTMMVGAGVTPHFSGWRCSRFKILAHVRYSLELVAAHAGHIHP